MKRGNKRAAISDPPSAPAASSDLLSSRSKRVMDGSSSDGRRAEFSQQNAAAVPPGLDPRRAEATNQHVRALNSQFASWVQAQLQHHPDELWEDGVKDYLSHSSQIMEKFKDVVDWLMSNTVSSGVVSSSSTQRDQNTVSAVPDQSKAKQQANFTVGVTEMATLAPTAPDSSSAFQQPVSQTSVVFSARQTPVFGGPSGDSENMPVDSSKHTLHFGGVNNGSSKPSTPSIFSTESFQSSSKPSTPSIFSTPSFQSSSKPSTPSIFSTQSFQSSSKPSVPSYFSTPSFQSNAFQSSTQFPVNPPPVFTGNQNTSDAPGDADANEESEQPSSPSVKKAEEKGIVVVHEVKCKVYVKDEDATKGWRDIGGGQLSIRCKEGEKKASRESKPTIIIRNDVGKILLNALIYQGIKMNIQKNTVASIFHTSDAGLASENGNATVLARPYLIRLKNEETATKLGAAIRDNAPSE